MKPSPLLRNQRQPFTFRPTFYAAGAAGVKSTVSAGGTGTGGTATVTEKATWSLSETACKSACNVASIFLEFND